MLIYDLLSLQHRLRHVVTREAERMWNGSQAAHLPTSLAQVNAYSFKTSFKSILVAEG